MTPAQLGLKPINDLNPKLWAAYRQVKCPDCGKIFNSAVGYDAHEQSSNCGWQHRGP